MIFFASLAVFVISLFFVIANVFGHKTKEIPVSGGEFSEGIVGQPSFVNPVLAQNNSPEDDLAAIIFDSIDKMAESIKTGEDGKSWTIRLKDGLRWQDGEPIVADDIVFTIESIQNPDSRSALFSNFQGVIVERKSEREIKLSLPVPYSFFDATLKKLRPIPKHIFGSIPPANFRLSDYNLEPVGSGPYRFVSYKKRKSGFIDEYLLARNDRYYGDRPYINRIAFKFYETKKDAVNAFNRGLIDGLAGLDPNDFNDLSVRFKEIEFRLPRYYAIFINSSANQALREKAVREALNMAADKKKIIESVFRGKAIAAQGPIIPGMDGYLPSSSGQDFSRENAAALLESAGWKTGDDGLRKKSGKDGDLKLEFSLVVPQSGFLAETADILKEDYASIGIKLNLTAVSDQAMNEFLRIRNYELLAFGNAFFGGAPDLFSYWHSSERFYPGLNLSLYYNRDADAMIEAARKDLDEDKRKADLSSAEKIITNDLPAVFLYSPNYIYAIRGKLLGIEARSVSSPSDRFLNIEKWHVKTARVVSK